ncbi:hypothetical protein BKA93DRAFT_754580 [Sparassis latifolia]
MPMQSATTSKKTHITEASKVIDLPTILGTQDRIAVLVRFIDVSRAFTNMGEWRKKKRKVRWKDEPEPGIGQADEEQEENPEEPVEERGGRGEEIRPRGGAVD